MTRYQFASALWFVISLFALQVISRLLYIERFLSWDKLGHIIRFARLLETTILDNWIVDTLSVNSSHSHKVVDVPSFNVICCISSNQLVWYWFVNDEVWPSYVWDIIVIVTFFGFILLCGQSVYGIRREACEVLWQLRSSMHRWLIDGCHCRLWLFCAKYPVQCYSSYRRNDLILRDKIYSILWSVIKFFTREQRESLTKLN